jgi:drug/metabolite transporter (DMT)-like permease
MTTLFYTASAGTIILTSLVSLYWIAPNTEGWLIMILLGVTSNLGHFSMIKAYELAPAPTVVPFTYANLLWMTLFGYILFSDLPDLWTISGACIVAGSGLYIFHRENKPSIPSAKA